MNKMIKLFLMTLAFVSTAQAESGPGNGTDYVKILFADAQYELNRSFAPLESPQTLALDTQIRDWLSTAIDGSASRFQKLKYYTRKMELRFQQEPCSDATRLPASICFYDEDPNNPFVIVSLRENKMTSRDQAMAMLLHEAGHFTGEKDHLFLDRMGVQLAQALKAPTLLIADAESTEVTANVFAAKEACDLGTSTQAKTLVQKVTADLQAQCAIQRLVCDLKKSRLVFQGSTPFERGGSFDMKVRCAVRAILDLRI